MTSIYQLARVFIDEKADKAVMSSIGGVKIVFIRRDVNVCAYVFVMKICWQGWNRLQFCKCSIRRIIAITNDCRVQFIDQVGILSIWVKRQMSRPSTGLNIYLSMLAQFSVFEVQLIDNEFVQSQINRDGKTIGRVGKNAMH